MKGPKKEHNGGVAHPVEIESNISRLHLSLLGAAFREFHDSLYSAEFMMTVTGEVIDVSYEKTATHCNRVLRRDSEDQITRSTVVKCTSQAGTGIQEYKDRESDTVLQEAGFFEDGIVTSTAAVPAEWQSHPVDTVEVDPGLLQISSAAQNVSDPGQTAALLQQLTVPEALEMSPEELEAFGQGPSEPFDSTAVYRRRRRTSRTEAADDDKQYILEESAKWINSSDWIDPSRKFLHKWTFEKSSHQTVYISIDAVLVTEQCLRHVRGGKPAMRIEKTYIKHWTIHVEADGRIYRIHHVKEHSAYKQLLAFLIRNGLLGRYLVFFIDGETKISDFIEKYFSAWDHTVYLDYHHLQEKIYDYMSSMIIAKRMDDPSAPVEYYKNGDRKGQPKPKAKTSLSRLFVKEASLIAWVGNTAALISYIRLIPAECIKNEKVRDDLLTYIRNKQAWITCYALRKKIGLKNSSNSVELTNQLLVSQRQKNRLMSWRDHSSSAVASVTSVYLNGEADLWFHESRLRFGPSSWKGTLKEAL